MPDPDFTERAESVQTCETCRFGAFNPKREYRDCPGMICRHAYVECRRYPPERGASNASGGEHFHKPWTRMHPEDWCGEHQPKDTQP